MKFPHVDIVKYRAWWFGISLALTVPGLIAIIVSCFEFGSPLKPGIDFTGGTITQYHQVAAEATGDQKAAPPPMKEIKLEDIRNDLEHFKSEGGEDYKGSQVQEASLSGQRIIVVRTKALKDDKQDESMKKQLDKEMFDKYDLTVLSRDKVSGVVGPELLRSGLLALVITLGAMVLYIGSRFQYDFAVCAIIALFHDVLVLIGIFALLGLVFGTEVDSLFISAILTVIGFSVHDTIVVFDRIRENMKFVGSKVTDPATGKDHRRTFGDVSNDSVNQTLARSIYTSLTVIITLTALYVLGGSTTRDFVLAMLIGIISGTYSSIFNASALLVWWRERQIAKGKGPGAATKKATGAATA